MTPRGPGGRPRPRPARRAPALRALSGDSATDSDCAAVFRHFLADQFDGLPAVLHD